MTKVDVFEEKEIRDFNSPKNGHVKIDVEPADSPIKLTNENEGKKKKKKKGEKDKEEEIDEYEEKNKLPPVGPIELFRYSTGFERVLIFIGILASAVAGLCMPAMIILFGQLTDAFVSNDLITVNLTNVNQSLIDQILDQQSDDFFDVVVLFGSGTGVIALIQLITGYIFVSTFNYASVGQVFRLRGRFLKSILCQEIGWFDTHQTNDFASRVAEDLNKMQEGIGEKIGMFLFFFITFFSSLINAFIHGWELTLVILSVFPLLGISTGIMAKAQSSLTEQELQEYAKAGSVAEEVISGIRTVAAFSGEEKEAERYAESLVDAKNAGVKRGLISGLGMGFMWVIIYGSYSLAFWYGSKLILDSRNEENPRYGPDNLVIVFFSVLMGAMNIGQAAPYVEAFNVARGAAAKIFAVIERQSNIDPTNESGKKPYDVKGHIEFRNIAFNYPSREDVKILRGLNMTIKPGQTAAVVGSSGGGKSTCIQLMQRFYDPHAGEILLDDSNIKDYNLGWLRDQIGVVGQEPVLFATTIAENIKYGKEGTTMDDIIAAAKEANAHDFIMKMPNQYETQVGERGAQMSGGQKQRIAIARALVKKPKILLLDEATSALDNQSEKVVQAALDKVRLGRTTIIVAHRLTTIRSADIIYALKDGVVAEYGSHEELMKLQGVYHSLVTAQLTKQDLDDSNKALVEENPESVNNDLDVMITPEEAIMDEIVGMAPISLTRTPSARHSIRRRASSASIKKGYGSLKRPSSVKEKEEEEPLPVIPLSRIMKTNAKEWPFIIGGVLGAGIQGCTIPFYAILFGDVLGTLAIADETEARESATYYAVLFLVIGVVAGVSMFFQAYMFAISGEMLTMRLRQLSFKTMLRQEMGWFDQENNSVGTLCSRLSADAAAVQGATGSRIGTVIQALTTLGLSMTLALFYNWRLGLITLPFIPFVLIAVYLQAKILSGQSLTESKILEDAGKIAIEAISNIRTVATLHKEVFFADKYSACLYEPHLVAKKQSHMRGISFGFAQCVPFAAYAVVMFYGGYLVREGEIKYGDVFKVAEALILGTMMVGQAIAFAPNYNKARVAASKIFSLLDRVPLIDSLNSSGYPLNTDINRVKLEKVVFTYPSRPDVVILRGLSVEVSRGQTLALVGSSGCGKSTIIGLLERFYDQKSGVVSVNGKDIQGLNVGTLRGKFGLVSQEPTLFDRTIAENIAYGLNDRKVTQEQIIEVAKQANIHEFIESLPNGYNTRVGSKGTQLSGGQKQRIAIARALVRNPSLLMLDEATSALDTESEQVVQEALEKAQKGRTSIVIAHRLSTIKNADVIAVVQGGVVVESGTHDDLMKLGGEYYSLYQTHQ